MMVVLVSEVQYSSSAGLCTSYLSAPDGVSGSAEAGGAVFDLVYCSEVIEHVEDVRGFAKALMTLIAPGGLLFLTTPADGHRATPKPLVSWVQVKPPEHLHWFARSHLLTLFDQPGYRPSFQFNPKPGHKLVVRRDL